MTLNFSLFSSGEQKSHQARRVLGPSPPPPLPPPGTAAGGTQPIDGASGPKMQPEGRASVCVCACVCVCVCVC